MNGWAKEIAIGNNADLITNKVSNVLNYISCYRWDNIDTIVHITPVGGSAASGPPCGLAFLRCNAGVGSAVSSVAFAKCYILN